MQVGQCTPSVECFPEYAQAANAVIDIYAVNVQLGAMALCTGASASKSIAHASRKRAPQCGRFIPKYVTRSAGGSHDGGRHVRA